ncbi:MAG: hypothetical protein V5783_10255 [Pontiella sp.]
MGADYGSTGKEVYFPQIHKPGKRLSFDFTHMDYLAIMIGGQPFDHLLFHAVLTFSNWQWIRICHSESLLALRSGIQSTLLPLNHVSQEIWSDHSSAATHQIGSDQPRDRTFNERYLELTNHYGITPRTIQVNSPHENGDVESANGVFKSRVNQHPEEHLRRKDSNHQICDQLGLCIFQDHAHFTPPKQKTRPHSA